MNKDFYKILGVTKTSTPAEIKKAYRILSKTHHPDVEGGSAEKFKDVAEAYSVLSDSTKKSHYDNGTMPNSNSFQTWGGSNQQKYSNPFVDFDGFSDYGASGGFGDSYRDIFEQFFKQSDEYYNGTKSNNNHKSQSGSSQSTWNSKRDANGFYEVLDINLRFEVTLEHIYRNDSVYVTYKRNVICSSCDGTGFDLSTDGSDCLMCDTTGFLSGHTCKYCRGSGRIHNTQCYTCRGQKVITKDEKLPLNNIYTHKNTKDISLTGYGHFSKYYADVRKKGDLKLTVIEKTHDTYNRDPSNFNLHREVYINRQLAITGGPFSFLHLDGKKYSINIPVNMKDGVSFKIPEKGLIYKIVKPTITRGDLILKAIII